MERSGTLRKYMRRAAAGAAFVLGAVAAPAQAQVFAPLVMPSMTAALSDAICPTFPAAGNAFAAEQRAPSKASAILGGQGSALEAMRAQQASFDSMGPLIPRAPAPNAAALKPLTALMSIAPVTDCGTAPGTSPARLTAFSRPTMSVGYAQDDFLASKRIPIGKTNFDASWSRVSRERGGLNREARRVVRASDDIHAQLETINRWVNRTITYAEDRDLFGKADYWAGPRQTMQLGKGDCEDYALLKMRLLEAAGVSREDMFLTIARDLVRRADHAVLIVRTPDGYRMLDNATDRVLDASAANDYQPVLSFSERKSWLHGY